LRDADIAVEFGVSRMPVREALRRLEDEGLVQAAASRWTRVSPLDIEEARRLHPIVSALEALAVRLIGSLDEVLIDRLEMANEGLRVSLAKGDPLEAWRADEAFHEVFVDAAHNPELSETIDRFKARLQRFEVAFFKGPEAATYSLDEHALVIDALERGDVDGAARAVDANWQRGLDRLTLHWDSLPDPKRGRDE
jgi:DNA-binding GntR family transcriptional regulator